MWCTGKLIGTGFLVLQARSKNVLIIKQSQRFIRRRMVVHGTSDPPPQESAKEKQKAPLTRMLDAAATFEDVHIRKAKETAGSHLPREDPFMSSPYTKETKIFSVGENAAEEANRRHIVDPSSTTVMLFPGQGTQYVGMCGESPDLQLFAIASEILGFDLLKLCRDGPIEQLNQTVYSQAAILVSSLSAMTKLERKDPMAIETSVSVAGFSIGEYAALVFAGVISFEDAVRLVKIRAEAMQVACDEVPSQMATVIYGADSKLPFGLEVAREWASREYKIERPVCAVASHLFPHGKVVAGHRECIQFLAKNYKDFNLRKVKVLPVSGAFHTELMKPAEIAVKTFLEEVEIQHPRIPVFCNVTSKRYHSEAEVRRVLPKQIVKPVLWEQIMHSIFHRPKDLPYPTTYEVGPGNSLRVVLKYANLKAHLRSESAEP